VTGTGAALARATPGVSRLSGLCAGLAGVHVDSLTVDGYGMASRERGSVVGRFCYSLGYLIEEADDLISGRPRAGRSAADQRAADDADVAGVDDVPRAPDFWAFVATTAAGLALAKFVRPKRVSWPRAVVAGVAATALAHLADTLEERAGGGSPTDETAADASARYVAGIATAIAYASLIYPRIPGPPLVRGLAFGAIEAATLPQGGILATLRQVSPRLSIPLASLALPGAAGSTPAANLAYGLGLGLVYRSPRD